MFNPDSEAKIRLFCFPFAGGGAQYYYPWKRLIGSDVDLCPVLLPGRERLIRSRAYCDMNELVPDLIERLSPAMEIPFAFFGHSMGALIGYNVAKQLREYDLPQPLHFFISAMYAPKHLPTSPVIHNLPEEEFISALKTFDGTPENVLNSAELMQAMLPYLRADFQMIETYRYISPGKLPSGEKLSIPFSLYGGAEDTITKRDLSLWKAETCSSCQLKIFPGGHFYISDPVNMLKYINREMMRLIIQVHNQTHPKHLNISSQLDLNKAI